MGEVIRVKLIPRESDQETWCIECEWGVSATVKIGRSTNTTYLCKECITSALKLIKKGDQNDNNIEGKTR